MSKFNPKNYSCRGGDINCLSRQYRPFGDPATAYLISTSLWTI